MRIYFSPIVTSKKISYKIEGESVVVTVDGVTDTFDFSSFPEGRMEIGSIETILPVQPICAAERVGGVLFIEVLNPIEEQATDFERFPNWIEVGEQNS